MGICRPLWNEARRITTNIVKLPEAAEEAAVLSHGIPTLREPSIPVRRWRHDGTHCNSPCVNDARPAPHGLFLRKRVRPGAAVGRVTPTAQADDPAADAHVAAGPPQMKSPAF
jgi:hypothetical protein